MRILFLSPRQCWPAHSGAKLREYHFLRALGLRGEVTYAYFMDPGFAPLTRDDLPFCRKIIGVPKPSAYGPTKLLQGFAGPWPLPILNYTSPQMSSAVERLIGATSYDIAHLDSIHMIRYGDALRARSSAKIIYNWHNVESEAMHRYAETVGSPLRQWYARRTARNLERCERAILGTATGHVVCSERERRQLLEWAPGCRVATIDNGVDVAYFSGAGAPTGNAKSRNLVFIGSMDYFPNTDAVTSFCNSVWPQIQQKLSNVRLLIVGANPSPAVQALAQLAGVTVTGTVPDVRPYYENALAAIVPLRTGGGTRLKILEAMAAGVPIISTPLGAEGLDVVDGRNILLADAENRERWIQCLLQLIGRSGESRQQIVAAGIDFVKTRYDWETLGFSLWNTYRQWLGGET